VIVVSDERFPVTWSGQSAVVATPAEVDVTNADGLRDALLEALNAGALGLVVDMTATTFCDSAGIAALTRAARRAAASDATLRLAVTAQPVLRVFSIVGIDRLIDIHPTVNAARESLPDQADGLVRLPGLAVLERGGHPWRLAADARQDAGGQFTELDVGVL
jgi:anti-anti-sigma factor